MKYINRIYIYTHNCNTETLQFRDHARTFCKLVASAVHVGVDVELTYESTKQDTRLRWMSIDGRLSKKFLPI